MVRGEDVCEAGDELGADFREQLLVCLHGHSVEGVRVTQVPDSLLNGQNQLLSPSHDLRQLCWRDVRRQSRRINSPTAGAGLDTNCIENSETNATDSGARRFSLRTTITRKLGSWFPVDRRPMDNQVPVI